MNISKPDRNTRTTSMKKSPIVVDVEDSPYKAAPKDTITLVKIALEIVTAEPAIEPLIIVDGFFE